MISERARIVIVGAGIVGASLAYHLARRNARVILVDRGQPAGGVTHRSFAWINVSYGLPETYLQLRHLAIGDWHRLESELGARLRIDWSGALTWHADPAETEGFAQDCAQRGHDVRLIGRNEIADLEPNIRSLPDHAAFAWSEGSVDPVAATERLVDAAREAGADVQLHTDILALDTLGSKITGLLTAEGRIDADIVLLAAGVGSLGLAKTLGLTLPLQTSPAILMRFSTPTRLVNRIVSSPSMEIRPYSDTIMLCAKGYIDASGENGPKAVARRMLAKIKNDLVGGDQVELADVQVGMRPFPMDGLPVVGWAPEIDGLYVCVMHAGVILSPLIGRLVASEISQGVEERLLSPYRLSASRGGV